MAGTLFCLGFGLTAKRVAALWQRQGGLVHGTVRSAEKAALLKDRWQIETSSYQLGAPISAKLAKIIRSAEAVLISTPPGAFDVDPTPSRLKQADCLPEGWIGYLSTTGIYGDHEGALVDETTTPKPVQSRARARLASEQEWQKLGSECFRLAGIYGQGRNALTRIVQARAQGQMPLRVVSPKNRFSRIHADDIARIVLRAFKQSDPGCIYNLCDDQPAAQCDVIAHGCMMLGLPIPAPVSLDKADLSAMARSFYQDRRQICNRRIKEKLGARLQFPSYREGLAFEYARLD